MNKTVLRFCPYCANLLQFREHPEGNRLGCPTCPYIHRIRSPIVSRTYFKGKERGPITDEKTLWSTVDRTDERCPKCFHTRAYFKQFQTRSADEAMTILYRCCNRECAHTWRVD